MFLWAYLSKNNQAQQFVNLTILIMSCMHIHNLSRPFTYFCMLDCCFSKWVPIFFIEKHVSCLRESPYCDCCFLHLKFLCTYSKQNMVDLMKNNFQPEENFSANLFLLHFIFSIILKCSKELLQWRIQFVTCLGP